MQTLEEPNYLYLYLSPLSIFDLPLGTCYTLPKCQKVVRLNNH